MSGTHVQNVSSVGVLNASSICSCVMAPSAAGVARWSRVCIPRGPVLRRHRPSPAPVLFLVLSSCPFLLLVVPGRGAPVGSSVDQGQRRPCGEGEFCVRRVGGGGDRIARPVGARVIVVSSQLQLKTNQARRPSGRAPDEMVTGEATPSASAVASGAGTAQRMRSAASTGEGTQPTTVMRPSPCALVVIGGERRETRMPVRGEHVGAIADQPVRPPRRRRAARRARAHRDPATAPGDRLDRHLGCRFENSS